MCKIFEANANKYIYISFWNLMLRNNEENAIQTICCKPFQLFYYKYFQQEQKVYKIQLKNL